jgi:two-component system phosphate regulon response regulator PhoB
MHVALLQHDPRRCVPVEPILARMGHTCFVCGDERTLSTALADTTVDLLVLDEGGRHGAGLDALRCVRVVHGNPLPVLLVSTDGTERSAVRAFAAGADDYITLPLRAAEFGARVAALLRRAYPARQRSVEFAVGPYRFDARHQIVMLHGAPVALSGTQYRLAVLFFANVGRVLSRDHIFATVWGRECRAFTRTIDSHVSRLRLLLQIDAHNGFRLQPVYRSGYQLLSLDERERLSLDRRDAQVRQAAA